MLNEGKLIFGAYTPFIYDFDTIEQQAKDMADAGINFAVLEHKFDDFTAEQKRAVFDILGKYNIDGVYFDQDIMKRVEVLGSDAAQMFDAPKAENANFYKDSKGFGGHMFVDEPGTEHFPELGKTVAAYQKMFPGKCPYINLLPMYANRAQLTGGAWMSKIEYFDTSSATFQKYLDEYVKYVPTDYICTDIYPCHVDGEGNRVTYNNYVKSIEITADTAKKAGKDFWCCIQTATWSSNIRVPNESDYRWQVYTLLSYGVKAFIYYIYAQRPKHFGMCVNEDLSKNEMYNISKRVTSELKRFEDVYLKYENLGAYSHNYSEAVPYLRMDNPYNGESPVKEIICDDPLLVGVFKEKKGNSKAFTLVNMSELAKDKTVNAKLKINGKVTAYYAGIPCTIYPIDGYYNFTLTTGDGIFVTVE
ncbi:MAG: hypothetical protein E7588_04930 [Ruminococcaceae bacterium]|nr:hypothetical protein [Oscillospiraceae bacterium]